MYYVNVKVHPFGDHEYTTFHIRLYQPKKKYNTTVKVSDGYTTIAYTQVVLKSMYLHEVLPIVLWYMSKNMVLLWSHIMTSLTALI